METGGGERTATAPAGWYPDAANPGRERLWTGERWMDWIRPAKLERTEATPAGWYPDAGHPGFERLWSGEMWTEEIRRAGVESVPRPTPSVPVAASAAVVGAAGSEAVDPRLAAPHDGPLPPPPLPRAITTYQDDSPPFRLGALGNWVTLGFIAVVLASVAHLIADQLYIGMESKLIDGPLPSLSSVQSATHAQHVTRTILLVISLITSIFFLIWFYRAYRNLVRARISDLRFGPGWALGGWFIPIFNYFRQKQIANDIWKASYSSETYGLARWREMPLSRVLNWWWATSVFAALLGFFGGVTISHANTTFERAPYGAVAISTTTAYQSLRDERTGLWITQVGLLFGIAAAVLAVLFVREVSRLQDEHFKARVPGGL